MFTGGHDVYHHLRLDAATAPHTDWAAQIDGWLQQAVLTHRGHYAAPGAHGHGHGRGVGAGAVVGGVAAGLVGGYLAGEVMDEVFDGGGGDFGDFGEE